MSQVLWELTISDKIEADTGEAMYRLNGDLDDRGETVAAVDILLTFKELRALRVELNKLLGAIKIGVKE